MIDLHTHVLPGLDDGPLRLQDSLKLLKVAAKAGTRTIVATPHLRHDFPHVRVEDIAGACAELQREIPASWNIGVLPGGEMDFCWALEASDEELRAGSLGGRGRDLLIETPHLWVPDFFEEGLAGLRARGYRIVLAHPELSRTFQSAPERLLCLAHDGVLLQITAASIARNPRKSGRGRLSHWLLSRGMVHAIASDAHSAGPWRPPGLQRGLEAARTISPDRAHWMVTAGPAAILTGCALPPLPTHDRTPVAA